MILNVTRCLLFISVLTYIFLLIPLYPLPSSQTHTFFLKRAIVVKKKKIALACLVSGHAFFDSNSFYHFPAEVFHNFLPKMVSWKSPDTQVVPPILMCLFRHSNQ